MRALILVVLSYVLVPAWIAAAQAQPVVSKECRPRLVQGVLLTPVGCELALKNKHDNATEQKRLADVRKDKAAAKLAEAQQDLKDTAEAARAAEMQVTERPKLRTTLPSLPVPGTRGPAVDLGGKVEF